MPTKLYKVSRTILKDRSGTDTSQVPAASATAKFYKQGATVQTAGPTTIIANTVIAVRDSGGLEVGDTVQSGTDSTKTATVDTVTSRTSIILDPATGTLVLSALDYLVPTSDRPTLYSESTGSVSTGSSDATADSAGLVAVYATVPVTTIIYSGTGVTTSIEKDVAGGYHEPNPWIDIRDYENNLVQAIAALPTLGGTIYMPSGIYTITANVAINVSGVHLLGDLDGGTIIKPSADNPGYHMFDINRAGFRVQHIEFDGRATSAGSFDIMRWNGYGVNGNNVQSMYLSECYFHGARRNCLRATDIFEAVIEKCLFNDNTLHAVTDAAVFLQSSTGSSDPVNDGSHAAQFAHMRFYECRFTGNNGFGLYADTISGLHVDSCRFESNKGGVATNRGNGIAVISSTQVSMHHCHFENPLTQATARANQFAYFGACRAVSLVNNSFVVIGGDTGLQLKPALACLVETCNGVFAGGSQSSGMNTAGLVVASDCGNCVLHGSEDYGTSTDADRVDNTDTIMLGNGVATVPRYATGSLPAYIAGRVDVGSLAYDTTTNNLKVLDTAHNWVKVGTQT